MKAVCWYGTKDVRVETVDDPHLINPHDAIVQVTLTAICGSDLHLYNGYIPSMKSGDILGHEFMGEVVDARAVRQDARRSATASSFLSPSPAESVSSAGGSSGRSATTRNPNAAMARKALWGFDGRACLVIRTCSAAMPAGRRSMCGSRLPTSVRCRCRPSSTTSRYCFLSDIFPTGYMAAENCAHSAGRHGGRVGLRPGRPVRDSECADLLGAERVIAIDRFPERLRMAQQCGGAEVINYEDRTMSSIGSRR